MVEQAPAPPEGGGAAAAAEGSEAAAAAAAAAGDGGRGLDPRRALVRKVGQLTKVVVHLNARNDEAEARFERLRAGFDEEVRTIAQDAVLKLGAERAKLGQLMDPVALRGEADEIDATWGPRREKAHGELEGARREAAQRRERLAELARSRLRSAAADLRKQADAVRKGLEAFREIAGRSRAELEQRDTELRERRDKELQAVAAEHQRRLEDLKSAQARELEHLRAAEEQAKSHLRRMHDSDLSTLRMQALQKRREKVHRLEQDFHEERRTLEQLTMQMGLEHEQQKQEMADVVVSCATMEQQVEALRATLAEMTKRVESAEADGTDARAEAAEREQEAAKLHGEVAVLQVRQRAAGVGDAPAPPLAGLGLGPPNAAAAASAQAAAAAARAEAGVRKATADLSGELREAIAGSKRLEAEIGDLDAELAGLDDDLTEKEKQVEILEVEIEEEQLRTHQLQGRVLQRETTLRT